MQTFLVVVSAHRYTKDKFKIPWGGGVYQTIIFVLYIGVAVEYIILKC